MTYRVEYSRQAVKMLHRLDKPIAQRIRDTLNAIARSGQPTSRGKALTGPLAGLWRYRVGDYRVICDIDRHRMVIIVVDVGHRSMIYR